MTFLPGWEPEWQDDPPPPEKSPSGNPTGKRVFAALVVVSLLVLAFLGATAILKGPLPAAPAYYGKDLDCADIGHPVRVGAEDPHRLDADQDGIGCEVW
jgi:hypothetical protein